jgi:predicted Rossmann fold flavoprotein
MAKMKKGIAHITVIGGGPAGLMAAGQAAQRDFGVTLLEKMPDPAAKLRLTGNGRCNITNLAPKDEFEKSFGRNGKFLRPAFDRFFSGHLIRFMEKIGVRTIEDDRGRVYPVSGDANEVADKLIDWTVASGARIRCNADVGRLIVVKNQIRGVEMRNTGRVLESDIVILATGGASYPSTGSTGDGYHLAKAWGHTIISIRPALVPLSVSSRIIPKLTGLSLKSVTGAIKAGGKIVVSKNGDLLFTHFGISGPMLLSLSRCCVDKLIAGEKPTLILDLLPQFNKDKLNKILQENIAAHGKRQIASIIDDFLPHRLVEVLLKEYEINAEKQSSQVTSQERVTIIKMLKELEFEIRGHRSWEQAMVTAGGVNLKEIDPQSMESKLVRGLYFAGEVVDLDGDTGGFNLQAAFSTGYLAGRMCAP